MRDKNNPKKQKRRNEKQSERKQKKQQRHHKREGPTQETFDKQRLFGQPLTLKKEVHKQFEINNSSQKPPKAEVKKVGPPYLDEFEGALQGWAA